MGTAGANRRQEGTEPRFRARRAGKRATVSAAAESQWIRSSQAGDTAAFNRLVLAWQERIYNLNLRMLGDPEDAAEATQESFLAAYRHIRRFRLDARFSTWLYRIAANVCFSRLRRRRGRPPASTDESGTAALGAMAAPDDPEGELVRDERRRQAQRALAQLPPGQRLAVELRFFQELTLEEVAEALGLPVSTAKSRFYAGLLALKTLLVELDGGTGR